MSFCMAADINSRRERFVRRRRLRSRIQRAYRMDLPREIKIEVTAAVISIVRSVTTGIHLHVGGGPMCIFLSICFAGSLMMWQNQGYQ